MKVEIQGCKVIVVIPCNVLVYPERLLLQSRAIRKKGKKQCILMKTKATGGNLSAHNGNASNRH